MPVSPPPVPVSVAAVAAYLAGLLAGFHGGSAVALAAATLVLAFALAYRATVAAGLALLAAAGTLAAHSASTRSARCEAALRARRQILVELEDRAAPGAFVRGRSLEPGCPLPVRLAVDRGTAEAGDAVSVSGLPGSGTRGLMIVRAAVRPVGEGSLLRRIRARASASIDSTFGADAPLAKALLVADTKSLSPEVRERYAAAGLVHMLSISGLHVGLIAVALSVAAQLARLPTTAARIGTPAARAISIAILGAPAPAVRAGVMLAAGTLCRLVQRPVSPWAVLALGAVGPLGDPATATDLGYQLSVVGVIALVAADSLDRRLLAGRLPGWRRTVAAALLGSTMASVVSLPLVAWAFGRVSLVAPLTNLVAAPLMAFAQPMLFLGLVLGWAPEAARFVAGAVHPLLVAFDAVALAGAALPYAVLHAAPTLVAAALGAGAVAAFVGACVSRYPARATAVALALVAALAWLPALPAGSGESELHVIDVGQGDAVALRTARGRWLLVDAGRGWRGGDAGRTTVVPYLRRRGGELEAFVLTHPHADHVGGAATVVRALRPRAFYDAAFAGGGDAYRAALAGAAEARVPWRRVRPGDSLRVDEAVITFLAPDSAWTAALADPNDASTVLLIRVGAVRFLLTGDAERDEEAWLVDRIGAGLRADVLKVAHHGSATSTTPEFLRAVRPRVAVISVGAANVYGHPDPATVRALAAAGARVLRTDRLGTIVVRTDGREIIVDAGAETWGIDSPSSND